MSIYDVPTYDPKLYNTFDSQALQDRIRKLETVVAAYREKLVGPYKVDLKIEGRTWQDVMRCLKAIMDAGEGGPSFICKDLTTHAYNYLLDIQSNVDGGPGETTPPPDPMAKMMKK